MEFIPSSVPEEVEVKQGEKNRLEVERIDVLLGEQYTNFVF